MKTLEQIREEQELIAEAAAIKKGVDGLKFLFKKFPEVGRWFSGAIGTITVGTVLSLGIAPGATINFLLGLIGKTVKKGIMLQAGWTEEEWDTFVKVAAAITIPIASLFISVYSKRKATELMNKWQSRKGTRISIATKKKISKKDEAAINKLILKYAK